MDEQTQKFLTTIAENVPKVKQQGYNEGFEAGKEKEWSDFWDNMQDNGNRVDYNYAFCSSGFTKTTFRPKYNINVSAGERMFYQFNFLNEAFDLEEHLEKLGATLDFSNNEKFYMCFANAYITRLGIIDFSKATKYNNNSAFHNSSIATIDKLVFSENTILASLFNNATALKNIKEVEGVIGTSVSFSTSPLTVESMKSIITHLKNCTGLTDTSGNSLEMKYTLTLKDSCRTELETASFTDEDKRVLEENGIVFADETTWTSVIGDLKWNLVWATS